MGLLHYLPWLTAPPMELYLAAVMVRRGLRRQFPVFFSYVIFDLVTFCLRTALCHIGGHSTLYFGAYWVTMSLTAVLGFLVIREAFQNAFRPYDSLREFGEVLFRWATFLLVLAGAVSAVSSTSGTGAGGHAESIIILARSVCMMQCGVALLMLLFSSRMGLSARNRVFGIALGFGLYASVELATVTMRSAFGPQSDLAFELLRSIGYNIAVATWIGYMHRPEEARGLERMAGRANDWNFTLAGIAHPEKRAASLSLIESSVDRVLRQVEAVETPGQRISS